VAASADGRHLQACFDVSRRGLPNFEANALNGAVAGGFDTNAVFLSGVPSVLEAILAISLGLLVMALTLPLGIRVDRLAARHRVPQLALSTLSIPLHPARGAQSAFADASIRLRAPPNSLPAGAAPIPDLGPWIGCRV